MLGTANHNRSEFSLDTEPSLGGGNQMNLKSSACRFASVTLFKVIVFPALAVITT